MEYHGKQEKNLYTMPLPGVTTVLHEQLHQPLPQEKKQHPWPTWKNIFRVKKTKLQGGPYATATEALTFAMTLGYSYVYWNNEIWFLDDDGKAKPVMVISYLTAEQVEQSEHDIDWQFDSENPGKPTPQW